MHVLGGGSIGFLFAAAIQQAGVDDVTMLLRKHHKPRLVRKPSSWVAQVQVCRPSSSDHQAIQTSSWDVPVEIIGEAKDPIKCILICTKANDAIPALTTVWDRLDDNAANVIILSNGALAIRDSIQRHFHDDLQNIQIITSTTTHGAYTKEVNINDDTNAGYCIVHAGDGLTYSTDNKFINACQRVGWHCGTLSEFEMNMMLWKKLAANCVINPLTAIHGVKNGHLLHLENNDVTMTHILQEVSSVATLEMESSIQKLEDDMKIQLLRAIKRELSVDFLKKFVTKVMTDTAENVSSMLQDVNANKTTEVRFLNGYVARLGNEKYNIDCKWNEDMCNKVEDIMS